MTLEENPTLNLINQAYTLFNEGNLSAAKEIVENLLKTHPNHVDVLHLKALILHRSNAQTEALSLQKQVVDTQPLNPIMHHNFGLMLLYNGDFEAGWNHYEWRRHIGNFQAIKLPRPYWQGEPIPNKHLLIFAEQGYGDTFQFIRYLPLIRKSFSVGQITCIIPEDLLKLLPAIPGIDTMAASISEKEVDYYISLLSLPHLFRTTLNSIPAPFSHWHIGSLTLRKKQKKLTKKNKLKIGLCWAGRSNHENDHNRSIALSELNTLFDLKHCQFFSLQKNVNNYLTLPKKLVDLGNAFEDFTDTAAAIMQLDVVISVDTSIAHLAASLGKPTWILLPYVAEWRWMAEKPDSPWYPTAKLFRQLSYKNWAEVINRVKIELIHYNKK